MITDELPLLLEQWALDIDRDGTPSQAGPSVEELRQLAQSLRSKPVAGVEVKPFMYGVREADGSPYFEEMCVSAHPEELEDAARDIGGEVVPLYASPQPEAVITEEMPKALAVYWEWMVSVATLGELADLERRMAQVGITLQRLGEFTAAMEEAIQP